MFIRFDRMYELDGQTHGQTLHDASKAALDASITRQKYVQNAVFSKTAILELWFPLTTCRKS